MTQRGPSGDQQNEKQNVGGVIHRVHQLGAATEELFERVYNSLARQQRQTQSDMMLQEKNDFLKEIIEERNSEIRRLQHILANIHEGFIMQDLDGRMVMINQTARDLIGNTKNFWMSPLGTLFDQYRDVDHLDAELMPLGEPQQIDLNNHVLSVQIAAIGDSNGTRLGTVILLRDLTRDTLSERMKRSFIAHISHELNTPMNVMRIASEILLSQPEDTPPNRKMLEKIGDNIDILARMVDELLDVSQIAGGAIEINKEPINLETLIWDVVGEFKQQMDKAGLHMTVMIAGKQRLYIDGDHKRLKWALGHLVRNAINYNRPDGDGQILTAARLIHDPEAGYRVILEIWDTGVGIADKDMPYIFDLFYRGEPRTPGGKRLDPRGLGQGLYVARAITEAHGGELLVKSRLGEGSTFTVVLPAIAPDALPERNTG